MDEIEKILREIGKIEEDNLAPTLQALKKLLYPPQAPSRVKGIVSIPEGKESVATKIMGGK